MAGGVSARRSRRSRRWSARRENRFGGAASVFAPLEAISGFPRDGWEAAKTFGPATVEPVRFMVTALACVFVVSEVLLLCLCP
ncbi:MAG: hypothetical protein AAFW01_03670 [Pseudomonadota bacterium]